MGKGSTAGALTVIETMTPNFSLIIHFRDEESNDPYELTAELYYATPETERVNVHHQTIVFKTADAWRAALFIYVTAS